MEDDPRVVDTREDFGRLGVVTVSVFELVYCRLG